MFGRFVVEAKTVTVKFGGQVEAVDVGTFTRVLLDYSSILQAACKEEDRNASIETNVRTVRPGCIEVDLSIIARTLGDLFADPTTSLATIANGIVVTSGFYGLVKFLGKHGKAVKAENDGGEVSVTAEDGTTTLVNNGVINLYMNCPQATEAVCKSFESLDNDPRVESVSIMSDGEEQFRAERDEFGEIASSPAYESAQTRTTEERVSLTVVKPVLEKSTSRKWEFVWRGEKITANVTSKDFIDSLGERSFSVGTVMDVDLRSHQLYDESLHAYITKRREVIEVYGIEPPVRTASLFDES